VRLSVFITRNLEEILQEWDAFARRLVPDTEAMDQRALRDHAKEILLAIARDMETEQTPDEQFRKSVGLATEESEPEDSAAGIHGTMRHASHFSMYQLTAEFRALRAAVLRLWLPRMSGQVADVSDEMVRFNEAIDQALAESVVTFSDRAHKARGMFLAILGHDLRAPLGAMAMAGAALRHPGLTLEKAADLGVRVGRGSNLMNRMVADLIEYTRSQLGSGMPIELQSENLSETGSWALEDARAVHADRIFEMDAFGDLQGRYDKVRMHQLLTNLLMNAAQYGASGEPVRLLLRAEPQTLVATVNNQGPVMSRAYLRTIFKPLVQQPENAIDARPTTSLGLGLYIAHQIAEAHSGDISVTSDESSGTTFRVRIPRDPQAEAAR
jgi:signal transduction histidine kinase